MLREPLTLVASDGTRLEGELVSPDEPIAGAVLTHPHPRHGGNMRSMVPGELIEALPAIGVATLRFNFRGMGNSEGEFENGVGERLDTLAAIESLHEVVEGLPIALCGSSFGADTALTVTHPAIAGWCAMAPPLREERLHLMQAAADSAQPKLLVIAERDQYRDPENVLSLTEQWRNTEIASINGADHFFVGRIEKVIDACRNFVGGLAAV